ncbi:MBL fold metallo-hydrolase [Solimicrobium silvestre]|uniref:Metal-dependent hydrolases of the beta-lactamase superfamily III n=1 Tax=Solimicrobium silvestre TaxID=2099400 RepID=A0A2S9GXQ4_9BURK|nr:MBL fold metallo-hydrolase [Solimicrobium silvestre]PRC92507.1 Metal-dependent hydrolases of the beta-lactamase superfamily III [Solimicrobium silvestre]
MHIDFNRRKLLAAFAALGLVNISSLAQTTAPGKKTRLILLGTGGGPTPKESRSAPAQVIVINDVAYVIDCGNGVARQFVSAGLKLSAIRNVFITHHHSDHNADYGNLLLLAWSADLAHRVDTYGPPPLVRMTRQFLELNDYDIQTRITDEGRPPLAPLIHAHEFSEPGLIMQDENVKVTATLVRHPPVVSAFAYRFDTADRSIVISGDTAPSDNLIRLAQGADVLVHEVMYMPALENLLTIETNAIRLKEHLLAAHSTAEQIGKVATAAKVKTLVLSHFVPGGYPYLDDHVWLDAVRPHFTGEIIVGRDLMEI